MSAKGIRGNIDLRRGLGSKTTDREKIMEDGPAGDWLALRSDQLLKWIDDAVYNASEATGMREVVDRVTRPIFNFAQRFSPHPLHVFPQEIMAVTTESNRDWNGSSPFPQDLLRLLLVLCF